jgi:hypothetical protein
MAKPVLCSRCKGVDAEDRPVACAMFEGGPCSACEEREVIRYQIEQLEEEVTKLKAKHRALGTTMNMIHDPFIHKLPPEIGSHIFSLCLPTLKYEELNLWSTQWEWARALRLGAVCRRWRQLAWTTPDLWDTLYLGIQPSMERSLAESLPGLLSEWLGRSGKRPLTIFFRHFGCSEENDSYNDLSNESTVQTLEIATDFVIENINLHSGRWKNLLLDVGADIPERLCGSIRPNQLLCLELGIDGKRSPTQKFTMKSKPFPTQLRLTNFSPTSITIGWDNITRATLRNMNTNECLELLRRAHALEHCLLLSPWDDAMVNHGTAILHRRLRSLYSSCIGTRFLEAINVPSLEEWTQCTFRAPLQVTAMVSLLERSSCSLKILNLEQVLLPSTNFHILFQAIPSLERLRLHFLSEDRAADGVMDGILARIFNSPPGNSTIPSEVGLGFFANPGCL